nr:hypothetical protein [Corynebacterium poyangense]
MIAGALDGKTDLILIKSVSRFARNTVDPLTYVRQSKMQASRCTSKKRRHLDPGLQTRTAHYHLELSGPRRIVLYQ